VETCYRHPNRETGVSCSSCGRPICPDCMTPTPVGMRCPECAPGPSRVQRATASVAPDTPVVTYIVMGICVAVFLVCVAQGMDPLGRNLASPLANNLAVDAAAIDAGHLWTLVTYSFVHAGLIHIGFNLFLLFQLGSMLEPAIGRVQFGVIYFVSVLTGAFGSLLLDPAGSVGASGGVFGLMAAAVLILRSRGVDPMATGLPLLIGLNLLLTFSLSFVSVGGHLGGLAGGALAGLVIAELPRAARGLPRAVPTLLAAGVGVLAVLASLAVA
jgi:membrane associated rhomboid family serine protease